LRINGDAAKSMELAIVDMYKFQKKNRKVSILGFVAT
jgi:hypothetical protein